MNDEDDDEFEEGEYDEDQEVLRVNADAEVDESLKVGRRRSFIPPCACT